MFEQVDATFQKGMAEHSAAVQQRLESAPTSLAMTLRVSNWECLFISFGGLSLKPAPFHLDNMPYSRHNTFPET